ncbi:PAS domain-containing protein [Apiospora arundinis]
MDASPARLSEFLDEARLVKHNHARADWQHSTQQTWRGSKRVAPKAASIPHPTCGTYHRVLAWILAQGNSASYGPPFESQISRTRSARARIKFWIGCSPPPELLQQRFRPRVNSPFGDIVTKGRKQRVREFKALKGDAARSRMLVDSSGVLHSGESILASQFKLLDNTSGSQFKLLDNTGGSQTSCKQESVQAARRQEESVQAAGRQEESVQAARVAGAPGGGAKKEEKTTDNGGRQVTLMNPQRAAKTHGEAQPPYGANGALLVIRQAVSSESAYILREKVRERRETEHSIINYKKSGEAFLNNISIVPIPWGPSPLPRFIFGFSNVYELGPPAIACRLGLDTPISLIAEPSSLVNEQTLTTASTVERPNHAPVTPYQQGDSTVVQGVEPVHAVAVDKSEVNKEAGPSSPLDLLSCLQSLENVDLTSLFAVTSSWSSTVLENMRALVQVLSPKGMIVYASTAHEKLGYSSRWVTLTLLEQHVSHLSSSALSEAHERSTNHGIWVKLSTSGLILHIFGDPYVRLGLCANELVGTALQDLMKQRDAKAEFETLLGSARYGWVVSSTVILISRRGHRLETNIVLHPGALGDRTRPYYFLAHCSILQPSARRKQKALLSEHRSRPYSIARSVASIATNKAVPASTVGDNGVNDGQDILGGLDPDRCVPLPYEIHQLKAANRALHDELQSLLKRAKQRRRYQRHGDDQALGCANCHTKVSPSGGAGPVGSATYATGAGCAGPRYGATRAARASPAAA